MSRVYAFVVLWFVQTSGERECDINAQLADKKPPVVLVMNSSQYQLAAPTTHDQHTFVTGKILLACPGKRNSLIIGNRRHSIEVEAICKTSQGPGYFTVENEEHQIDEASCAHRVTPSEHMAQGVCNGDGSIFELGYNIDNRNYNLIQACHRVSDGTTYYTRHNLVGAHFSRTGETKWQDPNGRPRFSFHNKALYRGFPPYKYLKMNKQRDLLTRITGDPEVIDYKREKFFAKGHLTPNADFTLSTWKDVTFLFVNTAPQWQEINGHNWQEIEKAVRNLAIKTGGTYNVVTGTYGVLIVNDTKLYLDFTRQRLPVPEYFFKLLHYPKLNKCVAFIANNFPLEEPPEHKCDDVCLQYGWPELKDFKGAGYIYCCSYEGLRKAFPNSIPTADCNGGVLKGAQ